MGNKYIQRQSKQKYKVINTQPHDNTCLDIAINDKNTLLGLGSKNNIKVQSFKNGQTKQLQDLKKHQGSISILKFFKKKPLLLSGSWDSSIIIWSCNLMSNPKYTHQLKGHSSEIKCVIVHPQFEDLLISSSDDKTIKFWSLNQSSWSCVQTIEEHNDFIFQISLNPDGNKLISCSCDNQIIIMEGSHKSQWQVVQKIQLNNYGYRLCFINNNMFAFQPYKGTHLLIFKQNSSQKLFHNLFKIPVQGGNQACWHQFPLKQITSNNNLVVKNGHYLNIIRVTQSEDIIYEDISDEDGTNLNNLQYELEELIEFQNNMIFGTVSENGEYLIIYDKNIRKIEIRRKNLIE